MGDVTESSCVCVEVLVCGPSTLASPGSWNIAGGGACSVIEVLAMPAWRLVLRSLETHTESPGNGVLPVIL